MEANVVLLVEDCAEDIDLLLHSFRQWGVTNPVKVLSDGQEASDYLAGVGQFADRENHPFPTVILLDLYLPGMSGLKLLSWVRSHADPVLASLPIVVLSGTKNRTDFEKAYAMGANACLIKTLDLAELLDLIKELDYFSLATPYHAGAFDWFPET